MHVQKANKFSQIRYLVNYNKRVWYIIANYVEPGQNKETISCLILHKNLPCYLWNVPILNQNNQGNTFLQFYPVDKGNTFRESWKSSPSTTKESISVLKCQQQTNSLSFETLSVYSNRQSTPKSVYHIFLIPPQNNENINRQSKGFDYYF